jgi:uncharacterized protein
LFLRRSIYQDIQITLRTGVIIVKVRKLGFTQFRIRSHENMARFEFIPSEMDAAWAIKDQLTEICQRSGFNYVTIDLKGYRTGSMNEVLSESFKKGYKNSDKQSL